MAKKDPLTVPLQSTLAKKERDWKALGAHIEYLGASTMDVGRFHQLVEGDAFPPNGRGGKEYVKSYGIFLVHTPLIFTLCCA